MNNPAVLIELDLVYSIEKSLHLIIIAARRTALEVFDKGCRRRRPTKLGREKRGADLPRSLPDPPYPVFEGLPPAPRQARASAPLSGADWPRASCPRMSRCWGKTSKANVFWEFRG